MNDIVIVLISLAVIIVFLFILGGIFFLIALPFEKKIYPLMDEVDEVNAKRTKFIEETLEQIEKDKRIKKINFDEYKITEEDTLSTMRNKQDVALILIKKIILNSKCHNEYSDLIQKIDDLNKESEAIFEKYNEKVSRYNTCIKFIFARPYAFFAKKKTYPLIF